MILIKSATNSIVLTPDKYEEDSDLKVIENESYTGVIYREVKKVRKKYNLNVVVDSEKKTVLEALEAEGTVSFWDIENREYTGHVLNLKFSKIAGADAYNTSFTFRGWLNAG